MTPNNDAYKQAGVDIAAGDAAVKKISMLAKPTHANLAKHNCTLLGGIGGFASAVQIPAGMSAPVLVSATDGVGSKLELAHRHKGLKAVGQDAVAMCVNDLLCLGASPLFFLDYIACHKLAPDWVEDIIAGMASACQQVECALVGGETAEMPSIYTEGKFDIAGFAVGIAEKKDLYRVADIKAGDALIAIASDGAHSNGYALINQILAQTPALLAQDEILSSLLAPTRLYCRPINELRKMVNIHGLAHITGGGVGGNLPRILPPELYADYTPPPLPPVFTALKDAGNLDNETMRRVFNCGIGMIAVVAMEDANAAIDKLNALGEQTWRLGVVQAR